MAWNHPAKHPAPYLHSAAIHLVAAAAAGSAPWRLLGRAAVTAVAVLIVAAVPLAAALGRSRVCSLIAAVVVARTQDGGGFACTVVMCGGRGQRREHTD